MCRNRFTFSLLALCVTLFAANTHPQERSFDMKLTSNSFQDGQMMDSRYTCDGKDISPHLAWSDVPEGTKSIAVSCVDPDAPMGDWIHWLIYGISPDATSIAEGGPLPAGAKLVTNDFRKKEYGGPCPPGGIHRYYFTVYALDTDSIEPANKRDFFAQVEAHTIFKAQVMGRYTRKR